jgi:hypothetical protein
MNGHIQEEQLTLHYYGEAEDTSTIESHLSACPECRSQYQILQRVLNSINAAPVPERGPEYGAAVWSKIAPRMHRSPWRVFLQPQRWIAVAAMAVLVLAAFFVGRYTQPGKLISGAPAAQVRDRILLVNVGDHLERSQMVLIELVNAPDNQRVDMTGERLVAENLVDANRLYRQTALQTGETGVASVLDDLERVLIEIAHSPDTISGEELKQIQHRIEDRGLLFKVRVIGSQIREQDEKPADAKGTAKL